jgi:hypothetical protein
MTYTNIYFAFKHTFLGHSRTPIHLVPIKSITPIASKWDLRAGVRRYENCLLWHVTC